MIVQVHSDAIQAGLETIKKLLDGRPSRGQYPEDEDEEDDEEFFERLREENSLEAYDHRPIAV